MLQCQDYAEEMRLFLYAPTRHNEVAFKLKKI